MFTPATVGRGKISKSGTMSSRSSVLINAADIVDTVREPLLVLDGDLRVRFVNRSFLHTFQVSEQATVGTVVYELGNGQWNILPLRELLERVLPDKMSFDDYEVSHDFPAIGRKTMLLNARRVHSEQHPVPLILLA